MFHWKERGYKILLGLKGLMKERVKLHHVFSWEEKG